MCCSRIFLRHGFALVGRDAELQRNAGASPCRDTTPVGEEEPQHIHGTLWRDGKLADARSRRLTVPKQRIVCDSVMSIDRLSVVAMILERVAVAVILAAA